MYEQTAKKRGRKKAKEDDPLYANLMQQPIQMPLVPTLDQRSIPSANYGYLPLVLGTPPVNIMEHTHEQAVPTLTTPQPGFQGIIDDLPPDIQSFWRDVMYLYQVI
jgi:hypothetical protein